MAWVGKLVKPPDCGSGAWGFDSPPSPHFKYAYALVTLYIRHIRWNTDIHLDQHSWFW